MINVPNEKELELYNTMVEAKLKNLEDQIKSDFTMPPPETQADKNAAWIEVLAEQLSIVRTQNDVLNKRVGYLEHEVLKLRRGL